MTAVDRVRAYLELSRLSNAPTVISNSLAGAALGAAASGEAVGRTHLLPLVAASLACTLLYTAGMALNDLADRAIDAAERPKRPIPSGRITARAAALYTAALIAVALWLLSLTTAPAFVAGLGLTVLIVLYDLSHGLSAWTVLLMGACRGMVYVVAGLAIGPIGDTWMVLGPGLCLASYVAGFSVLARREAFVAAGEPRFVCGRCAYPCGTAQSTCTECGASLDPSRAGSVLPIEPARPGIHRFHLSLILPAILLAAFLFLPSGILTRPSKAPYGLLLAMFAAIAVGGTLAAWLSSATRLVELRPPKIGPAVTMWIAGIALFDAYLLLLLRNMPLAAIAIACFVATRWGQRRIAGT